MNIEKKIFLDIIECIARNSKDNTSKKIVVDAKNVDMYTIYDYASKNKLVVPVFETTSWINITDMKLYKAWEKQAFEYTIKQINRNNATSKIISEARKRGLKAILFKGLVLANLYKSTELRTSSDTDILTDRDNEREFVKLLSELGYVKIEEKSKDEVYNYYNEEYKHLVELHFCLWEDFKGIKLDVLEKLNLESKTIEVVVDDMQLTTLNENAHLTYMMFHLIKHYILEGANLRFLLDMSMFVNRYDNRIDWQAFFAGIESLEYTEFTKNIFIIMERYMSMSRKVLEKYFTNIGNQSKSVVTHSSSQDNQNEVASVYSFSQDNKNEVINKQVYDDALNVIIDDLINAGMRGSSHGGFQMLGIMTPYLTGESVSAKSGLKGKLSIIFPSVKALDAKRFWYARRLPVLLPIAWVHKWINFVIFKMKNKGKTYSAKEKLNAAENRIRLLKESGLIK